MSSLSQSDQKLHPKGIILALFVCLLCLVAAEGILRWWDVADPAVFDTNADYGYLMRPNQSVSPRGYRFRINAAGLRGDDFLMPKPPGNYRIAFLGDSVTYGGGFVRDSDLFVNRVASALSTSERRRVETLNLAAPGWGIQNMAAYVKDVGLFDSDLVVWVISAEDFSRPKTSLDELGLHSRKPKSRLQYTCEVLWSNVRRWLLRGLRSHRDPDGGSAILQRNLLEFRTTLAQITRRGIPISVVVVPTEYGSGSPADHTKEFQSIAASCSVSSLDLAPVLLGHPSEKPFVDTAHLNKRGHEIVADSIRKFLTENALDGGHQIQGGNLPRDPSAVCLQAATP